MTFLFQWLLQQLYTLCGYITSFFGEIFSYLYQLLAYGLLTFVTWLSFTFSGIILLFVYAFDYFLQAVVYLFSIIFGGDVFGIIGLSTQTIEDNLDAVLAVAPYAKMIYYVANIDALVNVFHLFLAFLILWTCYRWFRVWVRG